MSNKISVITVVFNDVANIRATMESFFSQTWEDKEYIVIDGGSTDGTAEIIKEYADRLAYWCSEKDNGIYDAMNKGIMKATGDWINILNSGDLYFSADTFTKIMTYNNDLLNADVIYGDSIQRSIDGGDVFIEAPEDLTIMNCQPIYRHGSSFVKTDIHKEHLFQTKHKNKYGFGLDWLMIHTLFKENYQFRKISTPIEIFQIDGVSNNLFLSMKYNLLVAKNGKLNIKDKIYIYTFSITSKLKNTNFYKWFVAFITQYVLNDILPHIPFWKIRKFIMTHMKMSIGRGTFIMKNNYILTPQKINIGNNSHINRGCILDARGGIKIGNNVSVSYNTKIISGSHDINDSNFRGIFLPIIIEDYVWIGVSATILQNVKIGKGAVICANAVVTKDVSPYSIMAGIPAKKIGERKKDLKYKCFWDVPFT